MPATSKSGLAQLSALQSYTRWVSYVVGHRQCERWSRSPAKWRICIGHCNDRKRQSEGVVFATADIRPRECFVSGRRHVLGYADSRSFSRGRHICPAGRLDACRTWRFASLFDDRGLFAAKQPRYCCPTTGRFLRWPFARGAHAPCHRERTGRIRSHPPTLRSIAHNCPASRGECDFDRSNLGQNGARFRRLGGGRLCG